MAKPQFIPPPQELKRKAVNFKTGVDVALTAETVQKLETVIAANGDEFSKDVFAKLQKMRETLNAIGDDAFARIFVLPSLATLSLEIKGMGGLFGYPLLTVLAKSLNDFIETLKDPTAVQFDIIGIHVDAMYLILAQHVSGQGGHTEQELLGMLSRAIRKVSGEPEAE